MARRLDDEAHGAQWRHVAPVHWIPSMMWAKQFQTGELKVLDLTQGPPKDFKLPPDPVSFRSRSAGGEDEE